MAWDGDQVAAGVANAIYPAENESLGTRRGWLDSVFTRRQWRRRGLAEALIVRSLHLLSERGMTTAVLGVDAENPSGRCGSLPADRLRGRDARQRASQANGAGRPMIELTAADAPAVSGLRFRHDPWPGGAARNAARPRRC